MIVVLHFAFVKLPLMLVAKDVVLGFVFEDVGARDLVLGIVAGHQEGVTHGVNVTYHVVSKIFTLLKGTI